MLCHSKALLIVCSFSLFFPGRLVCRESDYLRLAQHSLGGGGGGGATAAAALDFLRQWKAPSVTADDVRRIAGEPG